jgi:hypothetical protein
VARQADSELTVVVRLRHERATDRVIALFRGVEAWEERDRRQYGTAQPADIRRAG